MSKIDIIETVKTLKPSVSQRVLRNHKSVYNVCYKHFKNDDFINKPEDVKKFYEEKYKNIKSRKSNYYILKTIAIALDKKELSIKYDSYAKLINKILEDEKKKTLEQIDKPPVKIVEKDEWDIKFDNIKNKYIEAKKEILKLFKKDKTAYTIKELQKFRDFTILAFYCSCFIEKDLYYSKNPPRRNEIRRITIGKSMKYKVNKSNIDFNILLRPVSNIPYFKTIIYGDYKKSAMKTHGVQFLKISDEINEALYMYLKSHKNILTTKLFLQNIYTNQPNQIYSSEAWSKLLKRLIGYSCNDIRKSYITKTYKKLMPKNNAIKQMAYRMGHSFHTAIEHYNKIPKVINK